MPDHQQQILDFLLQPSYRPIDRAALIRKLKLAAAEHDAFHAALDGLVETKRVRENRKGLLRPRTSGDTVAGVVRRTRSGDGYFIPHEKLPALGGQDVYLSHNDIRDAHSGDEVLVRLTNRRRAQGQRCGRVEEILVRASNKFVGTYFEQGGQGLVRVDGKTFNVPIAVGDPGALGARVDDKVVIEMLRFPMANLPGEAVLTRILGQRGETGVDTLSVIHQFGLPHEYPEEALEFARRQAEEFDEDDLGDRLDLTGETLITIDPDDARDFDDAISLKRTRDGHWHLGVHIADVAHFVPPDSPLDREALKRGTSVYLPQHVVPMLPELISNGLASLQQGRTRYTKSAFIEYSPEGIPLATDFANSAIRVSRRLTYGQAMMLLKGEQPPGRKVSQKVQQLLGRMHELAMLLRKRRFAAGALELNLREVELEFDGEGRVTGAYETEHDESHQIIEEFMLAANIAVATRLDDLGIPFLRRVHGEPDLLKLEAFARFAEALGHPLRHWQSRQDLQEAIRSVEGLPEERALNYALLRSMRQAEYLPVDLGHYALAVDNYCHFTSPIRRYPDLHIHRLIGRLLEKGRKKSVKPADVELERLGRHCSMTERRAADAERELTRVKLLTFMESRVGETYEAAITGVEPFGVFCQGLEIPVEGLIHITALEPSDYYYHEPTQFCLIGRRTGTEFRLGDHLTVLVARVDIDRRELDLRVVAPPRRAVMPTKAGPTEDGGEPAAKPRKPSRKRGEPAAGKRQSFGGAAGGRKAAGKAASRKKPSTAKKKKAKKTARKKTSTAKTKRAGKRKSKRK